jgi:hypothetical protein
MFLANCVFVVCFLKRIKGRKEKKAEVRRGVCYSLQFAKRTEERRKREQSSKTRHYRKQLKAGRREEEE